MANSYSATRKRASLASAATHTCAPVAFMQIMERTDKVCPVRIRRKLFRGVDWRVTKSRKPSANRCSGNFPRTLNPFDRYINITRSAARCLTLAYPGRWDKGDGSLRSPSRRSDDAAICRALSHVFGSTLWTVAKMTSNDFRFLLKLTKGFFIQRQILWRKNSFDLNLELFLIFAVSWHEFKKEIMDQSAYRGSLLCELRKIIK